MDFKVEDVSPVKKQIEVTVSPEEVTAALGAATALIRSNAQIDGFRKGKAPANVIERHFHDRIYSEARENLINVHINDILGKLDVKPVSGLEIPEPDTPMQKDKPFVYTIAFEYVPNFDIPPYEGLNVREKKIEPNEKIATQVEKRFMDQFATLKPVDGNGPAQDGQIANMDFQAFLDGKPLEDIKVTNYNFPVGSNEALPEFENLVKKIPTGHTAEGPITFPDDFLNEKLAGKTVDMKVTVNAIKEKIIPELTDDFAKTIKMEDAAKVREILTSSYIKGMKEMEEENAKAQIIDQLLKMTDFPVPPVMVNQQMRLILSEMAESLERQGRSLKSMEGDMKALADKIQPVAEKRAKQIALLLAIAKKENLEVSDNELATEIYKDCQKSQQDYKETIKSMEETGFLYLYRDKMLADKAIDAIYARANVEYVDADQAPATENAENAEQASGQNISEEKKD